MSNSGWDDMKRVREEEYFHKEEQRKIQEMKKKVLESQQTRDIARERITAFGKGQSPLTGSSIYKANISETPVLDCPEEGTIMMSYECLKTLLKAAQSGEQNTLNAWNTFLTVEERIKE